MKQFIGNPYFTKGFPSDSDVDRVSTNVEAVRKLLTLCPKAARTPLVSSLPLAEMIGIKDIWFKDERQRMGLGSFKALGAAYVIACRAADKIPMDSSPDEWKNAIICGQGAYFWPTDSLPTGDQIHFSIQLK